MYVDGYVLAVKKSKLKEYKKMAVDAGKSWIKFGAVSYVECTGDDLKQLTHKGMKTLAFQKTVFAKTNETVVFSFVTYKSKSHRNKVNSMVKKEMEKHANDPKYKNMEMPFDIKRMAYGGFKPIVKLEKKT